MVGTTPAMDVEVSTSSSWYGRGHPDRCHVIGGHFFRTNGVATNTEQQVRPQTAERLFMWFCEQKEHMLGEDSAVNDAGVSALRRAVATVRGEGEAHKTEKTAKRRATQATQAAGAKGRLSLGVARQPLR